MKVRQRMLGFASTERRRTVFGLALLLALSLLLRLFCVIAFPSEPHGDFFAYLTMARNLYAGVGLVDNYGGLAFFNSGYPFLIYGLFCLFGDNLSVILIANALLGTVSILLIYVIGWQFFGSRPIAFISATCWALYFPNLIYTTFVAKENLMIPLLLMQIVLTLKIKQGRNPLLTSAVLGVMVAYEAMVGSAALAVVPVLVVSLLHGSNARKALPSIAVIAGCFVLALSPWLYRNYTVFGEVLLNTNGGFNFYLGNNPNATGWYIGIEQTPVGSQNWNRLRQELGEHEAAIYLKSLAFAHIRAHPWESLQLAVKKFVYFWAPPPHLGTGINPTLTERLAHKVWFAQYLLLCFLALAPIARLPWEKRSLIVIYGCVLSYASLHVLFYAHIRYRLCIMSLICVCASYGLYLLYRDATSWWSSVSWRLVSRPATEKIEIHG